MSEEIKNASTAVPASIMLSVLINGLLGFGMLIAMLFCFGDIEAALKSQTGYPFMAIFLQATGSVAGTAIMGSIITTMGISTSVGMLATTSRQFWSFARDRGIPGWRVWNQVGLDFHLTPLQFRSCQTSDPRQKCSAGLFDLTFSMCSLSACPHKHRLIGRLQ